MQSIPLATLAARVEAALTAAAAAARAGYSAATVQRAAARGELTGYRIGRQLYFEVGDVDCWAASRQQR